MLRQLVLSVSQNDLLKLLSLHGQLSIEPLELSHESAYHLLLFHLALVHSSLLGIALFSLELAHLLMFFYSSIETPLHQLLLIKVGSIDDLLIIYMYPFLFHYKPQIENSIIMRMNFIIT